MDEYLGNSTYIKITYPFSEIKNRLNAFSKKLKFHISSLTFPYIFSNIRNTDELYNLPSF